MGVVARLFDADGHLVRLADRDGLSFNAAGDFDDLLDRSDLGSASFLRRVDPYGSLELTAVDMSGLIADVDALALQARPGPEANGVWRLRLLASRCAQLDRARLVLEGD